jgi:hypothetical protein
MRKRKSTILAVDNNKGFTMKNLSKLALLTVLVGGVGVVSESANASDYGCKALLCFAGGQGVAECQSTIAQVYKDLAKGRGFPSCDLSDGNNSNQNYAKLVQVPHWDSCPTGTTPLYNVETLDPTSKQWLWTGTSGKEGTTSLACVSGTPTLVRQGFGMVKAYPQITWLPAQSSNAINVFTDGKLFSTVRY